MADTKKYVSKRSNFTIHRPSETVQKMRNGRIVMQEKPKQPIEFSNGTYETADPEEQEAIEENPAFGATLDEGDVAPHPSERELEEAAEDVPQGEETAQSSALEQELEAADSAEEVSEILQERGLPGLPQDTTVEESETKVEDTEASADGEEGGGNSAAEDDLNVIEGVTKKSEALSALKSIQDIDEVTVGSSNNVDEIDAFAREHGYRFDGWPRG